MSARNNVLKNLISTFINFGNLFHIIFSFNILFSPVSGQDLITSACEIDYPPFSFVDDSGRATGFSVELMREALTAMDRRVTFRTGPWSGVRGWLERGEVEALPLVGRTPEREHLFDFTFPYMSLHGAIVVRRDTRGIQSLDDLEGRAVAVMKGDNAEEFLRREDRPFTIHTTSTFTDALRGVSEGKFDAAIIQRLVAIRLIRENDLTNLRVINKPLEGFRQDFSFAVKEGDRETLALLNEGLSIIMANGVYRHLHAKWFASMQLPEQRPIIVGGDENYPPYEFLNKEGKPSGFNVELTRTIARELGLDIKVRLGPWAEIRKALANSEIDALQGMLYSTERDLTFDFTPAHSVHHYVSVVRRGDIAAPVRVEEMENLRLVVQEGDIMHDFVLNNGLQNQVTLFPDQESALRALAEGNYDCALVSRLTALYLIEKNQWINLEVGNKALLSADYCYAAGNNHRALLSTFSQGLKVLEESGEYRSIYDKWLGVYREETVSFSEALRYILIVLIPLILLLLAALLWSWTLRRKVAERTEALRKSEEFQRAMIACSPVALYSIDLQGNVQAWNASAEKVFGWKAEEVIGKPLPIVPEDKQDEFAALRRKVMEGDSFSGHEIIRRKKDGSMFPGSLSASPIFDAKGKIIGIMASIEDMSARKKAEQSLSRSEALLNSAQRISKIGGWEWDVVRQEMFWTDETYRIHGYDPKAILGNGQEYINQSVTCYSKADRPRILEAFNRCKTHGKPYELECRLTTVRGRKLWIRTAGQAEKENGRIVKITGYIQDITEQKKVENELKENEEKMSSIFRAAPVGIGIVKNRVFQEVNKHVCQITGYNKEELIGKSARMLYPEEADFQFVGKEKYRQIDEHGIGMVETHWKTKDGKILDVLLSSTPIALDDMEKGVIFTVLDITSRKQFESALKLSEVRFRLLAESAPVGIVISDKEEKTVYVSRRFVEMFGYTMEDMPSVHEWWTLAYPDPQLRAAVQKRWKEAIDKARITKSEVEPMEYPVTCKDGGVRHIEFRLTSTGALNFVLFTDVTERRKLENQLTQAQKMEAVGRLAGGVAHDYNNMLNIIMGYAEMAREKLDPNSAAQNDITQILSAARRSVQITRQLLAFARKQTIDPRVLNLNEVVDSMLKMLRRLIGEDIDLVWKPSKSLGLVEMDPSQIDQVLANLCVNARDAIDGVGKVTIETHNVSFDEAYCRSHEGFSPGEYVMLAVSDNGCGMDKETLDNIFEPFFTTKDVSRGTGLGLSTVYGIVKQNNGFINVYSEPDKGTTFRIYFRRYTGALTEKTTDQAVKVKQGTGESVLFVEDDPGILNMGETILSNLDYNVLPAPTPKKAIRLAKEHAGAIHLLITDVIMPEMNGRALSKKIVKIQPGIKTLYMSGYTANVIAHHGVLKKGVNFIQKPFSVKELALKVREVLEQK